MHAGAFLCDNIQNFLNFRSIVVIPKTKILVNTSELDELIAAYESEKNTLEGFLKEALEETDYRWAHQCQTGLFRVKETLERLYHFRDPNFREKRWVEQRIGINRRRHGQITMVSDWLENEYAGLQSQLKTLQDQPAWVNPDENVLTDALYDLIEGKNAGFKLHLVKKTGFLIECAMADPGTMLIAIPQGLDEVKRYEFSLDWRAMPRLGFTENKENGRLEHYFPLGGSGDVQAIKVLLARLLFEHSPDFNYDRPCSIEFLKE